MSEELQKEISVKELAGSIAEASKVLGESNRTVTAVSPIDKANIDSVTFCNKKGEDGLQMVRISRAGVVFCHQDLQLTADDFKDKTLILVQNPRSAFVRVMKKHFVKERVEFSIAATAIIEKGAEIHPRVYIGPHCYIGKCEIGEGTIIYGNNYIYSNTRIGRNVIIHAGTVVGAEGVGFERDAKGELEKFPQVGGVIIEDNVEIGSNTSIMRGAMEDTIIGQGTRIGHLCNIGHSIVIGKHCVVSSCSLIGGHSRIGDYSQLSLGSCIRNAIQIGKNVLVGMGAVVTKNVSDNKVVFGIPAKEQSKTKRQ